MRYVVGTLLFGLFLVFATPSTLVLFMRASDGTGDPAGLLTFGVVSALIFGVPGFLAFPRARRLQAVAWLSLACMGYTMMVTAVLSFAKANPAVLRASETRAFMDGVSFRWGALLLVLLAELVIWAALFRRKRTAPGDSPPADTVS